MILESHQSKLISRANHTSETASLGSHSRRKIKRKSDEVELVSKKGLPVADLQCRDRWWYKCGGSVAIYELFKDLEQLMLRDLWVSVLVDGLDELEDFLFLHLSVAAQTLEGVVDKLEDLIAFEGAWFINVVFGEDCLDGLSKLIVGWLWTHQFNIMLNITLTHLRNCLSLLKISPNPMRLHFIRHHSLMFQSWYENYSYEVTWTQPAHPCFAFIQLLVGVFSS